MAFATFVPLACSLAACGVAVPSVGEIWDDDSGTTARYLERKVKEKIFCELLEAVHQLNIVDYKKSLDEIASSGQTFPPQLSLVGVQDGRTSKQIYLKPLPTSWGVTMALTFTVDEMSSLNPGVSLLTPMIPANTYFPNGITVPASQSYSFGLGGTLSSEAKRIDKYNFFYPVRDLEGSDHIHRCNSPDYVEKVAPRHFQGSSLLLQGDLGIYKWLRTAYDMRTGLGYTDKADSDKASLVHSYEISFEIVTSGSVTPVWKLVRVSAPDGSASLFGTKRDRTHDLLLTIGPTEPAKPGTKAGPQPSQQATNAILASQIGAAVANALRSSR